MASNYIKSQRLQTRYSAAQSRLGFYYSHTHSMVVGKGNSNIALPYCCAFAVSMF